jgi:outer membrane protein assembly factor BamA
VARLAELEVGAPLTDYDPERIRTALRQSPYFRSVGAPELRVTPDGGAILHVPIEETAPGAFDLVVGYLPPAGAGGSGQLVGSGHLLLEHLFGGGRRVDLTLDRRPGQSSIIDVSVSDPYIFGLPFRLTGTFRGEQRDSTYGERTYGLGAGYQFTPEFEGTGRLSREVVRPGQAGTDLRDGRQRIPRSSTLFYGVGVRYTSVDRPQNPRRGLRVQVRAEQGQKERTFRRVTAAGDTTRERESLRQERFRGTVRAFLPFFDRQVVVVGGDGAVLRSRAYDRSDLFRFGGAESLRGYDEDRFLGNVTVRGLLEYRLLLDRRSYVYAFGDLGYVERPSLGTRPATQEWHPGYGLGLQLQTAIGQIRTTYALNPEVSTPVDGRLHFGLSVGL